MRTCLFLLLAAAVLQEKEPPDGPVTRLNNGGVPVYSLSFFPDGTRLLSTGGGGRIWNLATGKEQGRVDGIGSDDSYSIAFTADGNTILGYEHAAEEIRLWDAATGHETISIFPGGRVTGVASASDARWVFSISDGIQRHDLRDFRAPPLPFAGHEGDVLRIAATCDGSVLASSGADGTIRIWNPQSGRSMKTLDMVDRTTRLLEFSPDGDLLASWGEGDRSVSIWDPGQGLRRGKFRMDEGDLREIAFSPAGRILATLNSEGAIELWEVASGTRLAKLEGRGKALCLALSRDGSRVAEGLESGEILVWKTTPATGTPKPEALDQAWKALAGDDSAAAWRALHVLAASGIAGRDLLAKRLTEKPGPEDLRKMLAELDDADAVVRARGSDKLEGWLHDSSVRPAVESSSSPEVRERLNEVLRLYKKAFLRPGEALRRFRAVWVLELQGAAGVLEELSRGAEAALQTSESKSALKRVRRK